LIGREAQYCEGTYRLKKFRWIHLQASQLQIEMGTRSPGVQRAGQEKKLL
jgi:hypothetical protein